eukprot:scaffold24383_cov39-Cyclotella_meneghiniana.AAC.1
MRPSGRIDTTTTPKAKGEYVDMTRLTDCQNCIACWRRRDYRLHEMVRSFGICPGDSIKMVWYTSQSHSTIHDEAATECH